MLDRLEGGEDEEDRRAKSLVEEESQGLEVTSTIEKPEIVEMRESLITGHHTMEFFEMCAALITQLAR